MSSDEFLDLYNEWVKSEYLSEIKPSCDRIDNSKCYSLDNIKLTTWGENRVNGHKSHSDGEFIAGFENMKVKAVNIETGEEMYFTSQGNAAKALGVQQQSVSLVVNGKMNKTKNYKFYKIN